MATALFIVSIPVVIVIVFDSINGVESFIGRGRSRWRRIKFRQVLHCILNASVHHVPTAAADPAAADADPGYRARCEPARCGRTSRQPRIKTAMTAEASGRLQARPPSLTGLSRKSPTVAPSGRVRMNAVQNSVTRDTWV